MDSVQFTQVDSRLFPEKSVFDRLVVDFPEMVHDIFPAFPFGGFIRKILFQNCRLNRFFRCKFRGAVQQSGKERVRRRT